jgi:hypothetical protein
MVEALVSCRNGPCRGCLLTDSPFSINTQISMHAPHWCKNVRWHFRPSFPSPSLTGNQRIGGYNEAKTVDRTIGSNQRHSLNVEATRLSAGHQRASLALEANTVGYPPVGQQRNSVALDNLQRAACHGPLDNQPWSSPRTATRTLDRNRWELLVVMY